MSEQRKNKKQDDQRAAAKKAAVLGEPKGNNSTVKVVAALALALLAGGAFWWWWQPGAAQGRASGPSLAAPAAGAQGGMIAHPVADLAGGKARFFSYKAAGGLEVRYFLIQTPDGQVRAALDACEVCWRSGLGYEQRGQSMVCRNCGRIFPSSQVGIIHGGCNPSPLSVKVEGGQALIVEAELQHGRAYFDLQGAGPGGRS